MYFQIKLIQKMVFTIFEIIADINDNIHVLENSEIPNKIFIKKLIKKSYHIVKKELSIQEINVLSDDIASDEIKSENDIYSQFYKQLEKPKLSNNFNKLAISFFSKINKMLYNILKLNIVDQEKKYIKYRYDDFEQFGYINNLILNTRIIISQYHMKKVLYFL